jgi:hypothetical protein
LEKNRRYWDLVLPLGNAFADLSDFRAHASGAFELSKPSKRAIKVNKYTVYRPEVNAKKKTDTTIESSKTVPVVQVCSDSRHIGRPIKRKVREGYSCSSRMMSVCSACGKKWNASKKIVCELCGFQNTVGEE